MKKEHQNKIWEYRVKYNPGAGNSAMNAYHYYNAENPKDALKFHNSMMEKHHFFAQTLSVERKCPYSNQWIDETPDD